MASRYRLARNLMRGSAYASYASWVLVAALLIFSHFGLDVFAAISMFACVICVAGSIIAEEWALRIYDDDHGVLGIVVMVAAAGFAVGAFVSFFLKSQDAMGTCVILLFVLSFAPTVMDALGVGYDEEDAERDYEYSGHTVNAGFDPLDLLGMGSPKTPPPLVIEQGEDLDDEWKQYLRVDEKEAEHDANEELIARILADDEEIEDEGANEDTVDEKIPSDDDMEGEAEDAGEIDG